ncbi:hypothetical protein L873DRAFT_1795931 [Choiromyces venosus 120613-1]|uniref:Uncharacterized protein n=1 Tax=Choiromyces venosus 120613-1 TaxID=1336337 RepID=A0A3N4IUU5_9PEZI|nr:hypothetical protein L873DRAFT_1795931 [Choiromyces venosus 120613-1]
MARLSKEKEKEAMRNAKKQVQETLVTVEDEGECVPNPGMAKDLRLPIPQLSGSMLYSMKWNIRQILIKPRPQLPVAYHQRADFDVLDAILLQPKQQPDSNLQENFEEGKKPKLEHVMGNVVIIKDKHGIPCVIKAGNQKVSWLLPQIEPAVHEYVASRNIVADHTRLNAMAITVLKVFAQKILPLTQTVEALFHAFLPEEYSKYKAVYETIYDRRADNIDETFEIWTSQSLVINTNTNNHKDLEDVCHGWCAIVPLGDFEGGDAYFLELGVRIACPPGNRYSIVHFTHQDVHDAYMERTGKPLSKFNRMLEWWQKSHGNLNV